MEKKKDNRGGKRKGAGRKKLIHTKTLDMSVYTWRKTPRINSHYLFGGKLAKAVAIQDIILDCKENKQKSYLEFLGVNPKHFIKKYIDIDIFIPYILSEDAIRYLRWWYKKQNHKGNRKKEYYEKVCYSL